MPFDYRENYHLELARRDALREAAGTPVGLLTLLGTALAFMVQKLRVESDWTTIAFAIIAALAAGAIILATHHLVRALHGHTYQYIETALQLHAYHQKLRAWHVEFGNGALVADREFDDHLQMRYAETSDHNARVNEQRSQYLFLTTQRVIFAGVFTGIALLPFSANIQLRPEPPQRLELSNASFCVPKPGSVHVATTAQPTPPPKPTPSPIRSIVEGQVEKNPKR
ncbi:MAG TPA: hypothetical protein VFH27_07865 [Longimicrobiaceae bacterium]|nr:hypothetical protein [Longimicrobiaceae bacterium]